MRQLKIEKAIGTWLPDPNHHGGYNVMFGDVTLGIMYTEVDGFYVFRCTGERYGFWSGMMLRAIADKLDELNAPWQQKIDQLFSIDEQVKSRSSEWKCRGFLGYRK